MRKLHYQVFYQIFLTHNFICDFSFLSFSYLLSLHLYRFMVNFFFSFGLVEPIHYDVFPSFDKVPSHLGLEQVGQK